MIKIGIILGLLAGICFSALGKKVEYRFSEDEYFRSGPLDGQNGITAQSRWVVDAVREVAVCGVQWQRIILHGDPFSWPVGSTLRVSAELTYKNPLEINDMLTLMGVCSSYAGDAKVYGSGVIVQKKNQRLLFRANQNSDDWFEVPVPEGRMVDYTVEVTRLKNGRFRWLATFDGVKTDPIEVDEPELAESSNFFGGILVGPIGEDGSVEVIMNSFGVELLDPADEDPVELG